MKRAALLLLLGLGASACAPAPVPAAPGGLAIAVRLAPASGYALAGALAPYRVGDVARLRLDLALEGGAVVASHELVPGDFAATVRFAPLAAETAYRLTGHALDASGAEISDPATSALSLEIGRDPTPEALPTLTVRLKDRPVRLGRMEAPRAIAGPTGWPAIGPAFWGAFGDAAPAGAIVTPAPAPALDPAPEALAYNGRRGCYLALFSQGGAGLRARAANAGGAWLAEAVSLEAVGDAPAVAHAQAVDEYVAVWEAPGGAIAGRRLKGDGSPNGPSFTLDAGPGGARPAIAWHPESNRYLVAWERPAAGGGTEVVALRLDASLAP